MRIGVHVSIAGKIDEAIDRAASLGCNTIQIFSRNPRGWKIKPLIPEEVKEFRRKRKEKDIRPILVHIPYLIKIYFNKIRNMNKDRSYIFLLALSPKFLDLFWDKGFNLPASWIP